MKDRPEGQKAKVRAKTANSETAKQKRSALAVMKRYRKTLRELSN